MMFTGSPTGPSVLLGLLDKESYVTLGCEVNCSRVIVEGAWIPGWCGEMVVTGSSGAQIGTLKYTTENVEYAPCTVKLLSPDGHELFQYQLPAMSDWRGSTPKDVTVTMGESMYATCFLEARYRSPMFPVRVERADGSGGTVVGPIKMGCWPVVVVLGVLTSLCGVGCCLLCLACRVEPTGAVKSLDGTEEYAPHSLKGAIWTVKFAPAPGDKRMAKYTPYDAKTKLDSFVGVSMGAVANMIIAQSLNNESDWAAPSMTMTG